jgi:tRNA-dihydrouridine synthase
VREPQGFRHRHGEDSEAQVPRHDKWVLNKIRALGSWYSKGIENGSHLRTAINAAESIDALRDILTSFFGAPVPVSTTAIQ